MTRLGGTSGVPPIPLKRRDRDRDAGAVERGVCDETWPDAVRAPADPGQTRPDEDEWGKSPEDPEGQSEQERRSSDRGCGSEKPKDANTEAAEKELFGEGADQDDHECIRDECTRPI